MIRRRLSTAQRPAGLAPAEHAALAEAVSAPLYRYPKGWATDAGGPWHREETVAALAARRLLERKRSLRRPFTITEAGRRQIEDGRR
jgi:hypothetical protein